MTGSNTRVPNDRPRLLLLLPSASYRVAEFVAAASRQPARLVIGSDGPQAFAAPGDGRFLALDFADREAALRKIVAGHAHCPLHAVLGVDEPSVELAAAAGAALDLAHNPLDALLTLHDKDRSRRAQAEAGLPVPASRAYPARSDPGPLSRVTDYPCVLKPLRACASRGVVRADDPPGFVAAWRRVAAIAGSVGGADARVLVEAFVPGREVALEGLIVDGNVRVLTVFDKPDPLDGPFFEESLYVAPARIDARQARELHRQTQALVTATGLVTGPVHAEFRLNDAGVWPIEVAARSIGGLCSRALSFADGARLEDLIVRQALGLPLPARAFACEGACGVMMIPIPTRGRLRDVRGVSAARAVPGIEDVRITVARGDLLVPLPEGERYLGFIFARAASAEHVEAALRKAHAALAIDIGRA